MADVVEVPCTALARLVAVAAHVSRGAQAAFIAPYPDATARQALGELDSAGLMDQFLLVGGTDPGAAFDVHAEESLKLANDV